MQLLGCSIVTYRMRNQDNWVHVLLQATEHMLMGMTYSLQEWRLQAIATVTEYIIWISVWNSQSPTINK